jgi:drug/metabolite transporter (DMT)-like permease
VALGFDLVFFFTAIKLTTIANATVIVALQPALLLFLAPWIFGERIRALDVATALVAIGGVALVVRGSSQNGAWSLRGDLFAVLTLFAWTAYLVASKKVAGRIRSSEFAASVTVIATLLITPLALFSEARFSATSLVLPTAPQLGLLATMALFGWGGHILMNWSLGRIPIWVGGMAALAIPVLTSALAALFLEEPLRPIQLLGMSVVIGSLAIVGVRSPKLVVKDPPA